MLLIMMIMVFLLHKVPFEVGCGVVMVEHRPVMPCVWCGAPGQLVCGVCGAWYCRKLCQAADWPLHSSSCSQAPASIPTSCPENPCEYVLDKLKLAEQGRMYNINYSRGTEKTPPKKLQCRQNYKFSNKQFSSHTASGIGGHVKHSGL